MSAIPELHTLSHLQLAAAIMSGEVGLTLFDTLCADFPTIKRHDVFLGIATAVALIRADLLAAELEARQLRRQLEQRAAA